MRIDNPDITSLLMQYTNAAHKIRRMEDRSRRETLLELIEEVLRARREPPSCPKCGTIMRLRVGRYGFFWSCPNYPRDTNTVNIAPGIIGEIIEELEIPCPTEGCEGYMRLRRSKTGVFLACSRYPDCRATISLS